MSRLPPNWETASVSEVAEIIRGLAFPSADKKYEPGDDLIACLRTANVQENVEWEDLWFIPRKHLRNERQIVGPGDILISTANSYELVGKVALVKEVPVESTLGAFISMIRPHDALNALYIYYHLASSETKQKIRELASTTVNISNVSTGKLAQLQLRIAPRREQERIATEIDKQFTRLDDAVAALKRVQANLKRYRASVLKAACEGRLVPTEAELARKEGRSYEPASELLKRILAERRAKWEAEQLQKMIAAGKPPKNDDWKKHYAVPETLSSGGLSSLPTGWSWASIGGAFTVHVGATPSRSKAGYWNGDIPWVSSGEVAFCRIKETREKITGDGLNNSSTEIHPSGTVLLGMIGEGKTRGQVAILDVAACNNQNSAAIRVAPQLSSEYLYYYLEGEYERTRRLGSGNNQPALNKTRVERMPFPLPPAAEQVRIASFLSEKLSIIDNIERECLLELDRASRLKSALLARAFGGKLVPQDPNDEPASVLLERVRAKRAREQEQEEKTSKGTNGAPTVNGQRRRRGERLAQRVSAGKGIEER